jgi:hypothetical protein
MWSIHWHTNYNMDPIHSLDALTPSFEGTSAHLVGQGVSTPLCHVRRRPTREARPPCRGMSTPPRRGAQGFSLRKRDFSSRDRVSGSRKRQGWGRVSTVALPSLGKIRAISVAKDVTTFVANTSALFMRSPTCRQPPFWQDRALRQAARTARATLDDR